MATSNDPLIKQHSVIKFWQLRCVRCDKDSILQKDNVRPHNSRQTQDTLGQLELTTLPHLAYSPNLAPSGYYLFLQLKKYLMGHHNDNDEEVITDGAVNSHLNSSLMTCTN
ncbi:histone-lysine N-methyltransferase SETMAR [Elysia marginata]|uniref:Histone-lysine N-methyltransferase SETMAR n=1 Tax=Elysia marginata TaxID=1093978 RepID=A0AAV4J2S1_9GAST|nr:histone-lysine N-methyltransferase SETMAR [Elysia marginata]